MTKNIEIAQKEKAIDICFNYLRCTQTKNEQKI